MNILYLTDELNYADGVSTHLFYLLSGLLKKQEVKLTIMCSGGDAIDKFKAEGIDTIVNKNLNHNFRNVKGFLSALKSVSDFCKKENIELIHSHNHYAANIATASLKIRISANIKTVQTIHGIIPETGKLSHHSAGSYIAVNDHVFENLRRKIQKEESISLIYNGIDFKENRSRKYNSRLKFVSAGRLEKSKGTDVFINAVSKLFSSERERADFIIAGEGKEYEALKKLDLSLDTKIEFKGLIKDLRKFFEEADVLVITSGSEGLPMTILEAAAEKVLVITSAFDGIENILKSDSDGLVFPVGDSDKLKDIMERMINSPETIKTYTKNFYNTASAKFNSDLMSGKHFDLYRKLLTNNI